MSFLAIDIGNTRLKWAQYASPQPRRALLRARRGVPRDDRPARRDRLEEAGAAVEHARLRGGRRGGASGAPRSSSSCGTSTPRWVVSSAHACGVTNGYEHPTRLGVDRWVALIGARHRVLAHGAPRPALVVMVGTAVTVDALDATGRFLGGLILPGFGLMLRALEMGTAGLKAPTGDAVDFPTNTSDALMSGGADAIAGAVERDAPQAAGPHRAGADAGDDRRRGRQAGADHRPAISRPSTR